jgi:hypothetical protein
MSDSKRGKGRPKGSETNDANVLNAMADMILADPGLRPTSAMRSVVPDATPAAIRRYQDKWKNRRDSLLADAQERRNAAASRPASGGPVYSSSGGYSGANQYESHAARALRDYGLGASVRAAAEFAGGSAAGAAAELARVSALTRAARLAAGSASQQMIDQIEKINAARDLAISPVARAMMDYQNSPEFRIMRELQENERLLRFVRGY